MATAFSSHMRMISPLSKMEINIIKTTVREALTESNLFLNDEKEVTQEFDVDGIDEGPVKRVGVMFTKNLTWNAETDELIKKAKAASATIKRIQNI